MKYIIFLIFLFSCSTHKQKKECGTVSTKYFSYGHYHVVVSFPAKSEDYELSSDEYNLFNIGDPICFDDGKLMK
jgi:hypothetical protein